VWKQRNRAQAPNRVRLTPSTTARRWPASLLPCEARTPRWSRFSPARRTHDLIYLLLAVIVVLLFLRIVLKLRAGAPSSKARR
jgi:hypothetical protein